LGRTIAVILVQICSFCAQNHYHGVQRDFTDCERVM
jgi:hypothetical protein